MYPSLDVLRRSFPDFDLIIADHRGIGFSGRLCPQEEAVDSAGGTALVGHRFREKRSKVQSYMKPARRIPTCSI
jgi:hypothetical protein